MTILWLTTTRNRNTFIHPHLCIVPRLFGLFIVFWALTLLNEADLLLVKDIKACIPGVVREQIRLKIEISLLQS